MKKAEVFFIFLCVTSTICKFFNIPFSSFAMALLFSGLAIIYFPLGYFLFVPKIHKNIIFVIILGLVLSICTITILLGILNFPIGYLKNINQIGIGIAGTFSLIMYFKNNEDSRLYLSLFIRNFLIGFLAYIFAH